MFGFVGACREQGMPVDDVVVWGNGVYLDEGVSGEMG